MLQPSLHLHLPDSIMTWPLCGMCVAGSKEKMMEAIVDRQVRQYQVSEYEKGQRATDYTTWLTSNVHYNAKFEEVRIMPSHSTAAALPGLLCDLHKGRGRASGCHLYLIVVTQTCA